MVKDVASCAGCRFWQFTREADNFNPRGGECRAKTPQLIPDSYERFPETRANDWCGEFSSLDGSGGWRMPTQPEPVEQECPF